jgi:hypothetical protein
MTAFMLEMVEKWDHSAFTLISFVMVAVIVLTHITRCKFLIFLVASTLYFLLFQFPDVANHVNLMIHCNMVMTVGIIYSYIHPRGLSTDNDYYEMIRPIMMMTLMLVYFLSGFHKLNSDFIHPEVSCVKRMLDNISVAMRSYFFGYDYSTYKKSFVFVYDDAGFICRIFLYLWNRNGP